MPHEVLLQGGAAPVSLRCDLPWKWAPHLGSFDVKGCISFIFRIARGVTGIGPRKSALRQLSRGVRQSRRAPSAPKIGIEVENRQKFPTSEGHTLFPIREWGCFPPESCKRRTLSRVLRGPKAYFFAGKLDNK